MGVHIDRTIALTFVLGGLMGGAAGFLFGLQFGVIYTMGFVPGLRLSPPRSSGASATSGEP